MIAKGIRRDCKTDKRARDKREYVINFSIIPLTQNLTLLKIQFKNVIENGIVFTALAFLSPVKSADKKVSN